MAQRIPVDGGFTCPNRDGKKGHEGCSFCNPEAFTPAYCRERNTIKEQVEAGKRFFEMKRRGSKGSRASFFVYFQSYSGTYAPIDVLRKRYLEALAVEGVEGIVIGTRPDCISDEILDLLVEIHHMPLPLDPERCYSVMVEYGVESCYDKTLLRVGRGHDFACSERAIRQTAARGIPVGVHLIFGLPGETEEEMLQEALILSELPIAVLKLHQLQILRGTRMAEEWYHHSEDFVSFTPASYVSFVASFVQRLRPDIHLERFAASSSSALLLSPRWGLKPQEIQRMIEQELNKRKEAYNG